MTSTVARVGWLRVVGTPLGNLGDISERAKVALSACDVILCEDSRRSGRLLQQLGLAKRPFLVANEHTEHALSDEVVRRMQGGERFSLISDAGMPGISDPGERLIRAAISAGLPVEVVPGPTAVTSALVLSGIDTSKYVFEGFLARKGKDRQAQLRELAAQPRTTVFYESPKRVRSTLVDLETHCGSARQVALARELTKLHEQVVRGSVQEVAAHFADVDPRGEFVIVVAGCEPAADLDDAALTKLLAAAIAEGSSKRDAISAVVEQSGAAKNRVYRLATELS